MWNLSESEVLLTISELSVAFAGFASLASILSRRLSKDDPRVDAGRLLNMLTVSLSLTALALVPFLPMLLEWPSRWTWGFSGAVGVAIMVMFGPGIVRRTAQMAQYPGFNQMSNAVSYTLSAAAFVGFFSSVLGIPSANPFAAYFCSVVALLVLCAILFYRVIASLLHPSVSDTE